MYYDSAELPNGTGYNSGSTKLKAYYANGRVYYCEGYLPGNGNAVGTALINAAKKYITFTDAYYSMGNYTSFQLTDSKNNIVGYVDAACDIYGKPVAIIHNAKMDESWVISCNWQK